ncbi:hypothetical protein MA16_Dca011856 [Dendrobium catenatum]|uniref:Uncharacterized protein n=1 Tax=Dendrobium catenatum TaxID=906689 RepID=A0A2I0WEB3_9ASPA|nr:hypothetical protein MA16_Dca011856 [Dendrobium catenatum]
MKIGLEDIAFTEKMEGDMQNVQEELLQPTMGEKIGLSLLTDGFISDEMQSRAQASTLARAGLGWGGGSCSKEFLEWCSVTATGLSTWIHRAPSDPVSFGIRANRSQVGGRPRYDGFSHVYVHLVLIFGGESASVVKPRRRGQKNQAEKLCRTFQPSPSIRVLFIAKHPQLSRRGKASSPNDADEVDFVGEDDDDEDVLYNQIPSSYNDVFERPSCQSSTSPPVEFNFEEFENPLLKSSSLPIFDEPVYDVYDDDIFFEVLDVDTPVSHDYKSRSIQEVIIENNNGGDECTGNVNAMEFL